MTTRRLAHQTRHSIGADRRDVFETPCLRNSAPFDALHDFRSGREHRTAVREVSAICAECPIALKCYVDNRDEEWVKSYLRGLRVIRNNPTIDSPPPPPRQTDELTKAHSRYESLRKRGEEIPPSVRDGERKYQQRRKRIQRARDAA